MSKALIVVGLITYSLLAIGQGHDIELKNESGMIDPKILLARGGPLSVADKAAANSVLTRIGYPLLKEGEYATSLSVIEERLAELPSRPLAPEFAERYEIWSKSYNARLKAEKEGVTFSQRLELYSLLKSVGYLPLNNLVQYVPGLEAVQVASRKYSQPMSVELAAIYPIFEKLHNEKVERAHNTPDVLPNVALESLRVEYDTWLGSLHREGATAAHGQP